MFSQVTLARSILSHRTGYLCVGFYDGFISAAREVHVKAQKDYPKVQKLMKGLFSNLPGTQIIGRVKPIRSIQSKLAKRTDEIFSSYTAKNGIEDAIAFKIVIDKPNERIFDNLVDLVNTARSSHGIRILGLSDLSATANSRYLNGGQFNQLRNMVQDDQASVTDWRYRLFYKLGTGVGKSRNGYTALYLRLLTKENLYFEVQILGSEVDQVAQRDHEYHDWYVGKNVSPEIDAKYRSAGFKRHRELEIVDGNSVRPEAQVRFQENLRLKYRRARIKESTDDQ